MKQFIDNLISRLEEKKQQIDANEGFIEFGIKWGYKQAIEIVNQLAEEYKPRTNADRIRSMDDAELTKHLYLCPVTLGKGDCIHGDEDVHCFDCILDWLQSEVKDGD